MTARIADAALNTLIASTIGMTGFFATLAVAICMAEHGPLL